MDVVWMVIFQTKMINLIFLQILLQNKINIQDQEQLKFIDTIDTILLGRKTYQLFADFWPTASTDKEVIADKLNETNKIVFTNTLVKAPWGKWKEAR